MSSLSSSDEFGEMILSAYQVLIDELSTDDEVDSAPRTRKYLLRDRGDANIRLMHHYFDEDSVYGAHTFKRRFRMGKPLFLQLVDAVSQYSTYFQQRLDARGDIGFSSIQKCAAAVRQLAYGSVSDSWDGIFKCRRGQHGKSWTSFVDASSISTVTNIYVSQLTLMFNLYIHIIQMFMVFPGMLGSLDCLHWPWSSCPNAWRGQYTRGDKGYPSVILEAVASHEIWIWHANFGTAGSNNDINVLNMSPIFHTIYDGTAPECPFQVNGTTYEYEYYLVDGIYHDFVVFVKTLTCPVDLKRMKFKTFQEKARKDVERAFGVLKKRWRILHHPTRPTTVDKLASIMYACIILHNMILEDEGKAICQYQPHENVPSTLPIPGGSPLWLARRKAVQNHQTHYELRADLAEHISRVNDIDLNQVPNDDIDEYSD